jgi:hypothetical protein
MHARQGTQKSVKNKFLTSYRLCVYNYEKISPFSYFWVEVEQNLVAFKLRVGQKRNQLTAKNKLREQIHVRYFPVPKPIYSSIRFNTLVSTNSCIFNYLQPVFMNFQEPTGS